MRPHELLELAALDAMGLLDESERVEFEQALSSASPALQAQVRREQARIALDERLLPDVDAPVGLRARVIAAVREAMSAITPRRQARGRILPLLPSRGVNPVWRAASIGSIAAALVLGFTTLQLKESFSELDASLRSDRAVEYMIGQFGAKFERALFNPNTQMIGFRSEAAADAVPGVRAGQGSTFSGRAVVLMAPDSKAQFYCTNFPASAGEYKLVVVDANGNIRGDAVLKFTPTGTRVSEEIDVPVRLGQGDSLAIIATPANQAGGASASSSPGQLLMRSNRL